MFSALESAFFHTNTSERVRAIALGTMFRVGCRLLVPALLV